MKRLSVVILILGLLVGACADGGDSGGAPAAIPAGGTGTADGGASEQYTRGLGAVGDGPEATYQALKSALIGENHGALYDLSTGALKQKVGEKFDKLKREIEARKKAMTATNPVLAETMGIEDEQAFRDGLMTAEVKEAVVYVEGLRGARMAETRVDGVKATAGTGCTALTVHR